MFPLILVALVLFAWEPAQGREEEVYESFCSSQVELFNKVNDLFATISPEQERDHSDATARQEFLSFDVTNRRPIKTIFGWASFSRIQQIAQENPKRHCALITYLSHDKKLLQSLEMLLQQIAKHERNLMGLWDEPTDTEKKALKKLYYKARHRHALRNYSPAWQSAFSMIVHDETPFAQATRDKLLEETFHAATGIYIDSPWKYSNSSYPLLNHLRSKVVGLTPVFKTVALAEKQFYSKNQHGKLIPLQAPIKKLATLVKTSTFTRPYTKWSSPFAGHSGRIRAAYALSSNYRHQLVPLLACIGALDVYVALAKQHTLNLDR